MKTTNATVKHIGFDDHKDTISVRIAEAAGGEARHFGWIVDAPPFPRPFQPVIILSL